MKTQRSFYGFNLDFCAVAISSNSYCEKVTNAEQQRLILKVSCRQIICPLAENLLSPAVHFMLWQSPYTAKYPFSCRKSFFWTAQVFSLRIKGPISKISFADRNN